MTHTLDDAAGFAGMEPELTPEQRAAKIAADDIEMATDRAADVILQAAVELYNARRRTKGWGPVSIRIPEETT